MRTKAADDSGRGQELGKKKLSYLEAREYAGIEAKVDAAEERLNAARDVLDDPSVATNAEALTARRCMRWRRRRRMRMRCISDGRS